MNDARGARGSDIRIRGTSDPDEIAVALALLGRDGGPTPPPGGIAAWRDLRRAVLSGAPHRRRPTEAH